MMNRPRQQPKRPPLTSAQIKSASYEGSPEHKAKQWWGGLPAGKKPRPHRQKTTICPLVTEEDRKKAALLVQKALKTRNFKYNPGDSALPSHIWLEDGNGGYWQGRLVNAEQGAYKGWPISEDEYDAISN